MLIGYRFPFRLYRHGNGGSIMLFLTRKLLGSDNPLFKASMWTRPSGNKNDFLKVGFHNRTSRISKHFSNSASFNIKQKCYENSKFLLKSIVVVTGLSCHYHTIMKTNFRKVNPKKVQLRSYNKNFTIKSFRETL